MAQLVLLSPDGPRAIELGPHNTLGRHPGNTIQLLDRVVSKEHCRIIAHGDHYVLHDLGSLNGTFVNGRRVESEQILRHSDEITLGGTRARFEQGTQLSPRHVPLPSVEQAGRDLLVGDPGLPEDASRLAGPRASGSLATSSARRLARDAIPALTSHDEVLRATIPRGQRIPRLEGTGSRIDVRDLRRSIGTQINAEHRGFLPYAELADNPRQIADDYERLRLSHELSREICLERDLDQLLSKILINMFRFVRADRGIIFLCEDDGSLRAGASLRRDGSETPIAVSSTIMDHVMRERATVLTQDALVDFANAKGKSMILNRISSAIVAPLLHDSEILGVLWLDSESVARFQTKDLELVNAIAAQAAMFIEITILGRKIEQEIINRERFSRLLSPNVAEKVLSGEMVVKKGGQRAEQCTVFNSDIRGFTALSEDADPESIVDMLNEYFELMVETIFKFDGTLDKFMGDGIMALWGAPVQAADDAIRCVDCALEQLRVLGEFNENRVEHRDAPLSIGIGIHTGPVVAGYIGSSKALSYTVIGETANISARLCAVAEPGQIIVSEVTLAMLGGKFESAELPPANLRNMRKPFRRFAILRRAPQVQLPEMLTRA